MNYTKGEWRVDDGALEWIREESTGKPIAKLIGNNIKANGRLIASAPDLYEALVAITQHFRKLDKLYSKDLEMLNLGSKALAKAEMKQ